MNTQHEQRFVSAAEITRNFGMWQDRAGQGPIVVTHHGRARCVLLSADNYEEMTKPNPFEPTLGQSVLEHQVLAERLDLSFLVLDRGLIIREANTSATILLAAPREALLDRRLADVLPALSESVTEAQFRRALRSGEAVRTRLQYNGETLHIHAFTWPGGLALTLRASTADDELERTEAEIEAIRRLLQMDRKMGIVRLSVRGTIAQVDEGFASLSKLPVERLLGVRFLDLLPRADRGRLGAAIEAVLGGERQAMAETVIVDNEGVDIAAHISITAIRDGFGASGAMLMIRDQRAF